MTSEERSLDVCIKKLLRKEDLNPDDIAVAYEIMVSGEADVAKVSALLTLLHQKGESPDELYGFARALREHAVKIEPQTDEPFMDTCGTGGDGLNTFNISTASMFILAAAGVPIAKHGNRGITSQCGSADLLAALGIRIDLPSEVVRKSIETIGIGFMFAPLYHPTMKHIAPIRKSLPFRTVFNILGPLANPAQAKRQVLGVFHAELITPMAEVLMKLSVERGMVFSGAGPSTGSYMDEISPFGITRCAEFQYGQPVRYFEVNPSDFHLPPCSIDDIRGYTPPENAAIAEKLLCGQLPSDSALKAVVKLNAAAGLYVADKVRDLKEGFNRAEEILASGAGYDLLMRWRSFAA